MEQVKTRIYSEVFAHRGFHLKFPENTIEAFSQAVEQNFSIELDVRYLKCGTIVCFHDRYMKRLLSVPGRLNRRTYKEIKHHKILGTKYKIPKLRDVLKMVSGKVTVLIEIKGLMGKAYQNELQSILQNYNGEVFFHAKNIITYKRARKIWGEKVFFVLNPFRKRFEFVKGRDYKKIISIPAIDDIIVEGEDTAKTVIKKIWSTFNTYTTRVKDDHWLINYNGKKNQIQHRGITSSKFKEHSKEAFLECVRLDKIIEFDIIMYDGKLICYHDDSITKKMGQKQSISQKCDLINSLTLEEILKIVDGKVPIIIDVKDFKIFNRVIEKEIVQTLKSYKGEYVIQSFNPLANIYLKNNYPDIIRGQIGHSLNGLKRLRKVVLTIVNFCLFYYGRPDYIIYDLDSYVYSLSNFNNILGLKVIGYTVIKYEDIERYSRFFDNFIVEGIFDTIEE